MDQHLATYFKTVETLYLAPSDPEKAAELLSIAARCIRAGEVLPLGLDRHIAEAFERAAEAPQGEKREQALLHALCLRSRGRRPAPLGIVKLATLLMDDLHAKNRRLSSSDLAIKTINILQKNGVKGVPVETTLVNWYRDFIGEDQWRRAFPGTSRSIRKKE